MNLSGEREAELLEAANLLLDARRTNVPVDNLPALLQPRSVDEAYFVQDQLTASHGGVGGWKVGLGVNSHLTVAPIPASWIALSGVTLGRTTHRLRGVEAEVAFLLGRDLPFTRDPYTREQVVAAIASCNPAIEVVESALRHPPEASALVKLADLQLNGGLVYGPGSSAWHTAAFANERVALTVAGVVRAETTGPSTGNDPIDLLTRLANEAAVRTGGLRSGQWISTGSWSGYNQAESGETVDVRFSSLGRVGLSFG